MRPHSYEFEFEFLYPVELHDDWEMSQMMRSTRQGSTCAKSEEMTMQQPWV